MNQNDNNSSPWGSGGGGNKPWGSGPSNGEILKELIKLNL